MELDLLDLVVSKDLQDPWVPKVLPDQVDPKDLLDPQVNQDRMVAQGQLDYKGSQVVLELPGSLALLDVLELQVPGALPDSQDQPGDRVCLVTQVCQDQMDNQGDQVRNSFPTI